MRGLLAILIWLNVVYLVSLLAHHSLFVVLPVSVVTAIAAACAVRRW